MGHMLICHTSHMMVGMVYVFVRACMLIRVWAYAMPLERSAADVVLVCVRVRIRAVCRIPDA